MQPRPLHYLWLWRTLGRVFVGASLVLALLPAPNFIGAVENGDKLGHAIAFAGLMGWYAQIYARAGDRLRCALGLAGLGALIELLQMLVPYRSADVLDLLADVAGIGLGWLLARGVLGDLFSWFEARTVT